MRGGLRGAASAAAIAGNPSGRLSGPAALQMLPPDVTLLQRSISQMKKGAILLNVSRGGLVESGALLAGLESQQLGGVGMDVSVGAVA